MEKDLFQPFLLPVNAKTEEKGKIAKVSNNGGTEPNGKMRHKACDICGNHLLIQNPNDQDYKEMEVNSGS